jgi:xanthine dehydrogenase accessory factor
MNAELLRRAVALNAAGEAAVLVRDLARSSAALVAASDSFGAAAALPAEILQQARVRLARDEAITVELEGRRFLLETFAPAARLVVIGAVHIAQKLVPMAEIAGYAVVLIDPRPAFATAARFPRATVINDWPEAVVGALALNSRTALVTLSHDAKIDEPALAAALASPAFYIGALGSQKNHAKRLARLAEQGFTAESLARIAAPIGLPLGGRSPAEIAIAIMAEIVQRRYAR